MAKSKNITNNNNSNKVPKDRIKVIVYLLLLLFAFIPTYNYTFDKKIAFLGDNASYYVFGKAIAAGKGYVNAHVVQESKVNSFPPGYPAIISVVVNTFGDDITTIKKANGVMYFISLVVLFFFFRQISKNIDLSFILTFVMMFNFYLLQYSTWMMSEISFILFTSIALLSLSNIKVTKSPWKCGWFYIMILSMAFAYHIRSQGIALFGGIFLYYLTQRNWKYLITSTVSFIALLIPWYIRNSDMATSPYSNALKYKNYYDHSQGVMQGLGDWIDRFTGNFSRYISSEISSAIFGYEPNYDAGSWFLGLLLLSVIGFGIFKLKKFQIAIAGYILGTFAILMIWPTVWTGVRFMLPLVPLLIFLFFFGIYQIIIFLLEKIKFDMQKVNKVLPYVFIIFFFVYFPKIDVLHKEAKKPLNPLYRNYFAMAKWTKKNIDKDAIVLCRKPMLFHLYSDHYVNGIIKNNDPDEALKLMKEGNYSYIVFYGDGLSQKYFLPLYQKYPKRFPIIQKLSNPDVYLMKIDTTGL
jgi:hypothetical protein